MSARVFLGRLPHDVREEDVKEFFKEFPTARNVTIKAGYGFVDFEDRRDAEEAVNTKHNGNLLGQTITVEFARERRDRDRTDDRRGGDRYDDRRGGDRYDDRRGGDRYDDRRGGDRYDDRRGGDRYDDRRGGDRYDDRRGGDRYDDRRGGDRYDDRRGGDRYDDRRGGDRYEDRGRRDRYDDYDRRPARPPIRRGYRLTVANLADGVSWQDLKDFFGKEHGFDVTFADAHKRTQGEGIVEFTRYDDLVQAIKNLSGSDIKGSNIELIEDESHNRSMFERNGEPYPRDSASAPVVVDAGSNGESRERASSRSPARRYSDETSAVREYQEGN